ncbi:MAG: hypothetical protein RMX26_07110, partial [Planktomarina sp.]|nr:hypothetical protein [Planktomarina sp.]
LLKLFLDLGYGHTIPIQALVALSYVVPDKKNTLGSDPQSAHNGIFLVKPVVLHRVSTSHNC